MTPLIRGATTGSGEPEAGNDTHVPPRTPFRICSEHWSSCLTDSMATCTRERRTLSLYVEYPRGEQNALWNFHRATLHDSRNGMHNKRTTKDAIQPSSFKPFRSPQVWRHLVRVDPLTHTQNSTHDSRHLSPYQPWDPAQLLLPPGKHFDAWCVG